MCIGPLLLYYLTIRSPSQVYGIASGLAYLHSQDVIHGDVKGLNVLLNELVQPVLCDFGMTKALSTMHNATSSAMKGVGSLRWMAPELHDDAPKSAKSDMFAFSMTIVEVRCRRYSDFK